MNDEKKGSIEELVNSTYDKIDTTILEIIDGFCYKLENMEIDDKFVIQGLHFIFVKIMMRCVLASKNFENLFSEILEPENFVEHMYEKTLKDCDDTEQIKQLVLSFFKKDV